jgi:drug/metabolite transporter (DMT)-like permease
MNLQKSNSEKLLLAAIVISMFLWGLSWPSGKVLAMYLTPECFVAWRFLLVVVTLYPILLFIKTPVTGNKSGIPYIIISGILLTVYGFLFAKGLKHGYAGAGGVLVTTLNPIIAYTLGVLVNRRRLSVIDRIGLLLGLLAGCVLLKIWENANRLFESGNLFFLSASFTWALMSIFTSRAKKFGTSFAFSLWQYIVTVLCIIPFLDIHDFLSVLSIRDSIFWLNMIFSSAVVTTLATTMYFYATSRIGPEKASSFIFLVPFGAELSSWLLLNEPILLHTVIGGLLGIAAVVMINSKNKRIKST